MNHRKIFKSMKYLYIDISKILYPNGNNINNPLIRPLNYSSISMNAIWDRMNMYRLIKPVDADKNILFKEFVPGNDETCGPLKGPFGKHFWWNLWHKPLRTDYDILTYYNEKTQIETIVDSPIQFFESDSRLYRINNMEFIIYERNLSKIIRYEFDYETPRLLNIYLIPENSGGLNQAIISFNPNDKNNILTFIDWLYDDGVHIYNCEVQNLNEYDTKNFANLFFNQYKPNIGLQKIQEIMILIKKKKKIIIKSNPNLKIPGESIYSYDSKALGYIEFGPKYGILPFFSLGTSIAGSRGSNGYESNLNTSKIINKYNNKYYLGVGHCKILADSNRYPYLQSSRIEIFRKNIYHDFKKKFGEKYIPHYGSTSSVKVDKNGVDISCNGYIYMMYFYLLSIDLHEFLISDSFLPVYIDNKETNQIDKNYKFSLFNPFGIEICCKNIDNDDYNVKIYAGEGDFYAVQLEFLLKDIVDIPYHNINNMDMRNYRYMLIIKKNDKIEIKERLCDNDYCSIGDTNGGYTNIYEYNKQKYQNLKI